ncbi:ABC transporter ATP-binding protein [Actomonas aquatica]|uniref:ABC transporter ATP-binding protein n=1 Tax=Actomonas aquatica TaxID=2866162 RepID=A0ABZ1C762_9BACT|nr:ABC transporter ATP-binding protein [Opitutus sp. WL0086]WRQ87551.1 ABC transporter ATP-binding protein [Opitutus sp. WL0086]
MSAATSSASANAVLAARGVAKSFVSGERKLQVLQDVAIEVLAGESVSIRGESGSGKSTLLHLLAGLDTVDGGEVRWGGSAKLDAARRGRFLGMVFQSFYLIPELTALDNVLMAARMVGRVGKTERARAAELLLRVGLAERAQHVPAKLSGGERQRVAVARALMNRPELLLADEPTGNLDERTGDEVINLLLQLCRETQTTLVLVTHNPAHAARTDRQLVLHEGRLGEA